MSEETNKKIEVVESVKKELITSLNSNMYIQSIPDVIRVSQLIEDALRNHLKSVLSRLSSNVIIGSNYNEKSMELEIRGRSYAVRVGENIRDSGILEVALVERPIEVVTSNRKPIRFQLSGYGRYKSAKIWLPDEVMLNQEWFTDAIDAVFQTGYRWLEEQIRIVTSKPELSIGIELYAYLRSVIQIEKILENIWFGCSIKGRGVFLIDSTVAFSGLNIIAPYAVKTGESALQLIAEYLGCDIPVEKTFGTIATKQNQCIDFELASAKYREDMPLFLQVQMAIMKSKFITVFPIFKDNSDYLQCTFPTEKKDIVLPIMKAHKEELAYRFAKSREHRFRLLKNIRSRENSFDASKAGSFAGGFIAGIIKEIGRP